MPTGSSSASEPKPSNCISRSAAIAPGRPSKLCTRASVAWLSDGSCTDQVASANAAIMAKLKSAIPPSSRKRRRSMAPRWPDKKATPSRLRSIIDMMLLSTLVLCVTHFVCASSVQSAVFLFADHALAQHRNEAMQGLGGDLLVLHHSDPNVVRARIAAVSLLARQITAGHDAHAGLAPERKRRRFATALRGNVEPQKEAAGRTAIAVATTDDLIGEIKLGPIQAPVLFDVALVVVGGDGDALRRHRHLRCCDVAQVEIGRKE